MSSLDGIQPTSAENALLASLREVLEEADYELGEAGSLAAGVVRVSGSFLKDVSVPHFISVIFVVGVLGSVVC